jgi:putative ABC transport system permease protein
VLTKAEFVALERAFQNSVSPVGPIFAFGTLIGFAVGMLISYQIMFTDLSDHMPQYATLKAIGYPNRYLVGVVLQQAAFYALAGFVPAIALAALVFWAVGEVALVPMEMGAGLAALCLALTVGMCVISGLIAVRRVLSADPAEVF